MRKTLVALLALSLQACATTGWHKSNSSAQIGCPEDQIEVTNLQNQVAGQTWTATCKGRTFYCQSKNTQSVFAKDVACKEALK